MRVVFCVSRTLDVGVKKHRIHLYRLPIVSPSLQVISLRDQIKRRQQGVDGGKDVREGFMHVGSSCFCVHYVLVSRKSVDIRCMGTVTYQCDCV